MNISIQKGAKLAAAASTAAMGLLLLPAVAACAADDGGITNLAVEPLDLDLGSSQGTGTNDLYGRLEASARTACAQALDVTGDNQLDKLRSCEQRAIEHAVRIANLPLLTAEYDRHFPGVPLSTALRISYAARDNVSGYMTALMPDGEAYSGEYLEPRQYAHIDPSDPFWSEWCNDESDASGSDCDGHVSGKPIDHARNEMLAALNNAEGLSMRCRFDLSQPLSGIAGGAEGECMLPAGLAVRVQIPRA